MKIIILGSGTSTGVPMVGCSCPVCTSDDPRNKRTRASIVLEWADRYVLIDTSPDLRKQLLREKIPCIDAVLFTHSHADHIHGIDDLRGFHFIHKRIIPCYGDRENIDTISGNFSYIFKGLETAGYSPLLEAHKVSSTFTLFGQEIIPIPLTHGTMRATGYRFGNAAYLTDLSGIPEASMGLLEGLGILLIDALRYTPHPNHLNIDGALRVVEQLAPRRTIFTHLTHEVSHSDGKKLPVGVELAYDGLAIELKMNGRL
jgi:phosphoribosyl 1,2-cyclic phosphate phosphodiesterase